ncbi:OmpA family protein [Shewanella waksmanii]|uniref:OmpA family protein n=1 Tax=Shewanella waksmanii TaxID=213783 RepID=UPI003736AB1F
MLFGINFLFFVVGCSNFNKHGSFLWDNLWEEDINNMVIASVENPSNFQYWVKDGPRYIAGASDQYACVEIKDGTNKHYFSFFNISSYSTKPVESCSGNYWSGSFTEEEINHKREGGRQRIENDEMMSKFTKEARESIGRLSSPDGKVEICKCLRNIECVKFNFVGLFEVNSYKISEPNLALLNELVRIINTYPVSSIVVYGIADSSGDYSKNKVLAKNRAEIVSEYLNQHLDRAVLVTFRGSVENKLSTAVKRQSQRRFEVGVFFHE